MFGEEFVPLNKKLDNLAELLNEINEIYSSDIKQARFRLYGWVIDENEVELFD